MFRPGAGCFWVAPTLGVIVPAFNEASTISSLLELVLAQSCVRQVVVVDDGSTDGTSTQAERFSSDARSSR
jgi:glycosyltransferase involved in cell wall biosynthesis